MVKFSKELEAQLIPEWKDAFANYWQLKKYVKKIKLCRKPETDEELNFGVRILGPVRYIVRKIAPRFSTQNREISQVKEFFERLDEELNNVNNFYMTKEAEFMERGENLKQLQILPDLKQILQDRRHKISLPNSKRSFLRAPIFRSLNMVAFTKILKKFDKVSNLQASASYLNAVKRSHFMSSDKVVRLGDEVESLFTKHFANNDRKKTMKFLRPQQQKRIPYGHFFRLFTGCFVSLFSAYAIFARLSGMFTASTESGYMEIVYPVFSMFALLSLHVFLYGCNLFMWRSTRINYNFIFEFSPSTALKYRDAFLICTSFMTMVVGAMLIQLLLQSNGFSPRGVDSIPGILFLLFTGWLICPFNIFYRSTRYCFLRVIRNIICSPFYKVLMVDFFMADQLTSQTPLLRHMEFTACYFIAGDFKTHQHETCTSSKLFKELAYVISFMPYYWRAMQCARRWFDEGDINHVANLGKYVSAMLAAGARLTYAMQPTPLWLAMVIVTSSVATVYQLYWDFVKDWGLLNRKSKNPWLRNKLILKYKSIYYASIALNFVLRLAWIETVLHLNIGKVDYRVRDFFLASLEIIRRGHWNFYRLENEHLNNAGKFRAVKTMPLPFQEIESAD